MFLINIYKVFLVSIFAFFSSSLFSGGEHMLQSNSVQNVKAKAVECRHVTGVVFIIRKENKVALFKRNIPGKIGFGMFGFPGGKVENNETVTQTACREAAEEIGLIFDPKDVSVTHIMRIREKCDPVTHQTTQILTVYFVEVNKWIGQLANMEPGKHSNLGWYDVAIMRDMIMPLNLIALDAIKDGVFYSEHGWD